MAGMDARGKENLTFRQEAEIKALFKKHQASGKHRATDQRREDEMSESPVRVSGVQRFEGSEGMKSPSKSVTEQNFSYLQDNIERLFVKIDSLEQRLQVVLTDGQPDSAGDRMGYGGNTPLSENLAMLCRRTQDLHDRLEYLTARIDL